MICKITINGVTFTVLFRDCSGMQFGEVSRPVPGAWQQNLTNGTIWLGPHSETRLDCLVSIAHTRIQHDRLSSGITPHQTAGAVTMYSRPKRRSGLFANHWGRDPRRPN